MSSDSTQIVVVVASVCGGVAIVAAIIVTTVCVAYWKDKLLDLCQTDTREESETDRRRHHHRHRRRRRRRRRRDIVDQSEEEDDETTTEYPETRLEDAELQAHRPPPSYERVHQYSSIETDLHLVTGTGGENGTSTRVSMYIGDEDTTPTTEAISDQEQSRVVSESEVPHPQDTLPPTYSTAQLEAMAAMEAERQVGGERLVSNLPTVGEEFESVHENGSRKREDGGSLPPSYSTARLELAKTRGEMEQTTSATDS